VDYDLAQLNIGIGRGPIDSPVMAEFVANLDRINAVAEASPGFVWRLKADDGNATSLRPFGDPDTREDVPQTRHEHTRRPDAGVDGCLWGLHLHPGKPRAVSSDRRRPNDNRRLTRCDQLLGWPQSGRGADRRSYRRVIGVFRKRRCCGRLELAWRFGCGA
jgi:Domain of unknown function (DUF3291)